MAVSLDSADQPERAAQRDLLPDRSHREDA
jgi:hypothetical protein